MKVRRVCCMLDADEASAILVALHRYIVNPPLPLEGTTYDDAARRAFDLVATRSAPIRGRLTP